MTTPPAPDVDRVLDRMGRAAFDYRSFPRPDDLAAPLRDAAPAMPGSPASDAVSAHVRFPLIAEALPASMADTAVPPAAIAQPQMPPPRPVLPNPFLPHGQAASPGGASRTSLAGMFRVLSGRADAARLREEAGAHESAFPFRHG